MWQNPQSPSVSYIAWTFALLLLNRYLAKRDLNFGWVFYYGH